MTYWQVQKKTTHYYRHIYIYHTVETRREDLSPSLNGGPGSMGWGCVGGGSQVRLIRVIRGY